MTAMLIEKEVIAPGDYWYIDQKTNKPRKLSVTPDHTKYWLQQGSAMLSSGLTVPVPYEHDFNQHPMTAKELLLNNAGDVKEYYLKDFDDPIRGKVKDALFSKVHIKDSKAQEKVRDGSIQWTSPWFNTFTDGNGKTWPNVISHLALTTRPRITAQQPFDSIAAALSVANASDWVAADGGYCLSRAGLLLNGKPAYPMAFSLYSGAALGDGDMPPPKKGKKPPPAKPDAAHTEPDADDAGGVSDADADDTATGADGVPGTGDDSMVDLPPLGDKAGDVSMEEVLCDLLRALGVDCQHDGDEAQFKRNLYAAAMKKVHDLTSKGMNKEENPKPGAINAGKPPGSPGAGQNPLVGGVQQEQQPMYMSLGADMSATLSLEDIQKIPDPTMRSIALSLFNDNQKIRAEAEADRKKLNSLNESKLREENAKREQRIAWLSRVSPKAKARLEKLVKEPSMALSMGDGGTVVDPMADILSAIEDTIGELPRMLVTDSAALGVQPHPKDGDEMSEEDSDKMADLLVRRVQPVTAGNGK